MRVKSLRMIEHFLAACRAGSFHAAARDIGISQTAITKSIRELENTLDVLLFDRSVKGVGLTIYGEQFQRRAIQIELQTDFMERELAEMIAGQAGCIRIGAGTVWSDVYLPGLLAGFYKTHPNVEFIVRRSVGSHFRGLLEEGQIDLGLGLEPSSEDISPELVFEPIVKIGTAYFVRQGHPLTLHKNPALKNIIGYPWAMYRLDTTIFNRVRQMFMDNGVALGEPSFTADSTASVMSFVAQTDHVTCLPIPMQAIACHFNLVPVKPFKGPTFQSGAVYMQAAADYPLMKEMLKALQSYPFANFE